MAADNLRLDDRNESREAIQDTACQHALYSEAGHVVPMRAVFRTDASLAIGTGHVMRCLTLADALRERGASCHFVCRAHAGNLLDLIHQRGYQAKVLPAIEEQTTADEAQDASTPAYASWLGTDWATDAQQVLAALGDTPVDWLIVDHYALDLRWEHSLRTVCRRLMVIDDLADRPHDCDVLLDQTFGRAAEDYKRWVPVDCTVLCGSQYALLRPEFATLRSYSLRRRKEPKFERLLVFMGGVDKDNVTGQVLEGLKFCALPATCRITVVMGASAPWLPDVRQKCAQLSCASEVRVNVSDMAQLMADSDLAIGAGGATTWERCCLGLPTAMVVLADNQKEAAALLEQTQAVVKLRLNGDLTKDLSRVICTFIHDKSALRDMSAHSRRITDGTGCQSVLRALE